MGGVNSGRVGEGLPASIAAPRRSLGSSGLEPIRRRRAAAYGAGPWIDDALDAARRLSKHGIASTVGYSAAPEELGRAAANVQLSAFDRLSAGDLDCYVSVKLSEIGFDAGLLAELDAAAARSGRRLHLDALAPETADTVWRLLEGAPRAGALGVSFPGRWRRSADDASRAAELGLAVRVVKGQWACGADGDVDPREGFLGVVDRLCGHPGGVAVATHDVTLLTEALRRLSAAGTPCEVELLYGLPFRAPAVAAWARGIPVRLYVPYGDVGATYGIAALKRNPTAAWWLVQDLVLGKEKTWRSVHRARGKQP